MRTPLWFPVALLAVAMLVSALMSRHALAQVAAPQLDPLTVQSESVFNPATLSFRQSAVGGVVVEGVGEDEPSGQPATEIGAGDGSLLQARWVGETFAASAERFSLDIEFDPATFIDGAREFTSSLVGIAGHYNGVVSVGIAQRSTERIITSPPVPFTSTDEGSVPLAGVTLRFGERFYIGASAGDETVTHTEEVAGTTTSAEADRGTLAYGVAYRTREDSSGWHLELYREEVDPAEQIAAAFAGEGFGSEFDGVTVEVVFANVLVGYGRTSGEETDALTGDVINDITETSITVGWAPMQGLNVVAGVEESEETDPVTSDVFRTTVTGVGAAWLF